MALFLESSVLGRLVLDPEVEDWWMTNDDLAIPYFGGIKLPVTFQDLDLTDPATLARVEQTLGNFLHLTGADRLADTKVVLDNYQHLVEYSDEALELKTPGDIWRYVYPTALYVGEELSGPEQDLYVQIEGNCEWEPEHGLALVFRQGRLLTRLSQYDGHLTETHSYGKAVPDPLMERYYARFGRTGTA